MNLKNQTTLFYQSHKRSIRNIFWALTIGLTIGVIGYQVFKNWQDIQNYPWQWNTKYIIFGFIIYTGSLLLTASVWSLIITKLSGLKAFITHVSLFSITNLAQRLPTPLPYIGARTEAYSSVGIGRVTTMTAITLEVTVTIVGALFAALLTLPFGIQSLRNESNYWTIILLFPFLLVIVRPKLLFQAINYALKKLKKNSIPVKVSSRDMLIWTSLFVLLWINSGVIIYYLGNSIYPLPINRLLTLVNISAFAGLAGWLGQFLFFLPSLAIRQITMAYLLSYIVPWPAAIAIALLTRIYILIFELAWAFFFGMVIARRIKPHN